MCIAVEHRFHIGTCELRLVREAGRIDGIRVAVRAANHKATFDAGLKSFINEARLLAQFDHPSLVKVYRFWEANGTAYMVMPFYEGDRKSVV